MEPNEKRRPSGQTSSKDTVLVRFVTQGLPPDSPEFQERANRPLSERGPNLALYREQQKAEGEQPPTATS
jgi:hypothetical protein